MYLRGASAGALAALSEQLKTVGSADGARVGDDLFAVAAVLRSEPGLRRVATDQSTDGSAKSSLMRQLFGDQVSAVALELVTDAVTRRWTSTRDLADVLEHLGVVAVARSVGDDGARLSDELFTVGEVVNTDVDLRAALSDPARSVGDKAALLGGLLEGKALPATVRLAELSLNGSHRTVNAALTAYQKVAAAVQDEGVARVRVAHDINDSERTRLRDALTRQYGRKVHLNVIVDPDMVGGMRIEVGGDVIDGSVSSRLDEARRKLAG